MLFELIVAISLRWTMIEHKNAAFVRSGLAWLFSFSEPTRNLYKAWLECPFCNGVWFGAAVYGALVRSSWLEGVGFAIAVGYLSLMSEAIVCPFLVRYENLKHSESTEIR